jgi:hypothetical protein
VLANSKDYGITHRYIYIYIYIYIYKKIIKISVTLQSHTKQIYILRAKKLNNITTHSYKIAHASSKQTPTTPQPHTIRHSNTEAHTESKHTRTHGKKIT